jgi:elongation factor P
MATVADFKRGLCIEMNKDLYIVLEFLRFQAGRGASNVRTKLKSLSTGKIIDHTFGGSENINIQTIERRPHQFLYKDENGYNFMHQQTYEQIMLMEEMIDTPEFLKDGLEGVEIVFHAEKETALYAEIPEIVEVEITYTEPGVKGDSSGGSLKAATVDSGARVMVPLFIEQGEKIRVNTRTKEYKERVNKH